MNAHNHFFVSDFNNKYLKALPYRLNSPDCETVLAPDKLLTEILRQFSEMSSDLIHYNLRLKGMIFLLATIELMNVFFRTFNRAFCHINDNAID